MMYVSFGYNVWARTFWVRYHKNLGSAVLSRLFLYSAGSGVNRVQVVLSEFSVNLVQEGQCVLGASCLVCQDLVSCNFYFVLLPLRPELW